MSFKLSQDFRDRTFATMMGTFKLLSQLANTFRVGIFGGAKANPMQQQVAIAVRDVDKVQSINDANQRIQAFIPVHKQTIGLKN